ncbi:hypothetical protein [Actinomycetospora chibensis]|uniref:Flagellar FliJ protein n=1 Tax=Actinomycetospora chibensis TaxID=663606 RepID=A0ABV9RL19_9PSEU|nr:hypothetical protein [Actinomycetospora chibensis]MDD7927193.1 hypothetical protein [Actinomycetospora chibensis]
MSTELREGSTRLDAAMTRRHRLDEQVVALETFERRLAERVHAARTSPGRSDSVRELLSRLLGVRARLQEAELARTEAVAAESRLRDSAREEQDRVERTRREADDREEFYRACLSAPSLRASEKAGDLVSS